MNYCNKIFTASYTLRVKIDLRKKFKLKMNEAIFFAEIDGQKGTLFTF